METRRTTQNLYFNLYWHEFAFGTLQLKIFTVYSIGRLPVSGSLAERKSLWKGQWIEYIEILQKHSCRIKCNSVFEVKSLDNLQENPSNENLTCHEGEG